MRITTKAVFDLSSGDLLEWEGYDYEGPIEHCGGGPSDTQKAAQAQTLANATKEGQLAQDVQPQFLSNANKAGAFYGNEMKQGLPFFGSLQDFTAGTTAHAFDPMRSNFLRQVSTMGALPSGFKAAGLRDINAAQAQRFDNNMLQNLMLQQQAKQQGAQGVAGVAHMLNPAAFYGGSSSAGSAAMQPLQPAYNPLWGVVGGAVQGAASKIPF